MKATQQHRVTFYSPGTFVAETTMKPIDAWDPVQAVKLSQGVEERYGAHPYAFRFSTWQVHPAVDAGDGTMLDVEPKQIAESGYHFLKGRLIPFDDVPESDQILRGNMRGNRWPHVVQTVSPWRWTQQFTDYDCIVDGQGKILVSGLDVDVVAYRQKMLAEWTKGV